MGKIDLKKRQNGRFYTEGNPFSLKPFQKWMERYGLQNKKVLEPFAGANNIIRALQQHGYAQEFASFDIEPQDKNVRKRDTLESFPSGFELCITNPPWLAKNSANRRGLAYPDTKFDDLYKFCIEKCLEHSKYVAALIPATYLRSGDLRPRLDTVIFLHDQGMFLDTENPVCLALFSPNGSRVRIFNDNLSIGYLDELEQKLPEASPYIRLTFNHPRGVLGLIAIDNTREPSIRFVHGNELSEYEMKVTSRMITRIQLEVQQLDRLIARLNKDIEKFRTETKDVFLTPFKGLRKDGYYRRRIDYSLARDFIAKHTQPRQTLDL